MASFLERVYEKCERSGECLLWKSPAIDKEGFPLAKHLGKTVLAHRAVYEVLHGPIPEGMVIVQTCNHHACLEDEHLNLMTRSGANLRAKSPTCKNGHPRDGNLFYDSVGRRRCLTCLQTQVHRGHYSKELNEALPQLITPS